MPGVPLLLDVSFGLEAVGGGCGVLLAVGDGGGVCRPPMLVVVVVVFVWDCGSVGRVVALASSVETFFRRLSILSLYASFNCETDSNPSSRAFCSSFS